MEMETEMETEPVASVILLVRYLILVCNLSTKKTEGLKEERNQHRGGVGEGKERVVSDIGVIFGSDKMDLQQ
ncbi:hypothetical protein PG995_016019 [Apiospora arundinis]